MFRVLFVSPWTSADTPFCHLSAPVIFVSPELSSGRDLVIHMSVRRAASAVRRPPSMVFCPEHVSGSV